MSTHSAVDTVLGFRYQELYALLLLWRETDDDAQVFIETLDDVVLVVNGQTLLEQLKHSLAIKPTPLTIKSVSLWKTLKVWIDILPEVELTQTRFNLVSVADLATDSLLKLLLEDRFDRTDLLIALEQEAERVQLEREVAKAAQVRNSSSTTSAARAKDLPHTTRAPGCEAFLNLTDDTRAKLINKISLKPGELNIKNIEQSLADCQSSVTARHRAIVAQRLVEWWDRQVLHSMCGMRKKGITRFELIQRHMTIVSELELDQFTNPFETATPPFSHLPSGMIDKQISLVNGSTGDLKRAIREEWRARETRSIWSIENPARRDQIAKYDDRLVEEWCDRHTELCEDCDDAVEEMICVKGLKLLKWSHYKAPNDLEAIAATVVAPYYVRGSYQVLSIVGRVGWHPEFRKRLGFEK